MIRTFLFPTLLCRSMLRAKYKAEDYLTNSYARKKKVSTTSSQDSTESPPSPASPVAADTPPPSPPPPRVATPTNMRVATSLPPPLAISSATLSVSRKLVDLKQPEPTFISRKSLPDNFNSTAVFNDKNTSDKKWSVGSRNTVIPTTYAHRPRPSELSFNMSSPFQTRSAVLDQGDLMNRKNQVFKVNSAEIANMTDNKINTDDIEDNVNVKERATIFGPRRTAESKVGEGSIFPGF